MCTALGYSTGVSCIKHSLVSPIVIWGFVTICSVLGIHVLITLWPFMLHRPTTEFTVGLYGPLVPLRHKQGQYQECSLQLVVVVRIWYMSRVCVVLCWSRLFTHCELMYVSLFGLWVFDTPHTGTYQIGGLIQKIYQGGIMWQSMG